MKALSYVTSALFILMGLFVLLSPRSMYSEQSILFNLNAKIAVSLFLILYGGYKLARTIFSKRNTNR